jgi:CRP/FNR family cyclic AMP-dependent transcriptional regulator
MHQRKEHVAAAESILARMEEGNSKLKLHQDQIVYSQGDPANYVLYIRAGTVKVTVITAGGKEAFVAVLQSGNFCGEECLTGQRLRTATITALGECVLIRLPKASVVRALHEDAEFSELFTTCLVERGIRMQEDLVDQRLNSTEKRLARLLLTLANYGADSRSDHIVPRMSQEALAEMVGTSRTHVNFFMNKFRQQGFIEYNGDIKVRRSLLNAMLQDVKS